VGHRPGGHADRGLSYAVFALISARVLGSYALGYAEHRTARSDAGAGPALAGRRGRAAALADARSAVVGLHRLTGVPEMIAKTPWAVVDYLFLADTAPKAQEKLLAALMPRPCR
jgi:sulfonate transport system permease protein